MLTLSSPSRIVIAQGASGSVISKEYVSIPAKAYGITSIRRRLGDLGLINSAQFIESGYEGYYQIQLTNRSPNPIEIYEGDEILNLILVPKYEPDA